MSPLSLLALGFALAGAVAACHKQAPAEAPAPAAAIPAPVAPVGGVAPPAASDACTRLCGRARSLGCKHDEGCVATCRQMTAAPTCGAEMAAVLACLGREPLAHWECNETGEPAIKDGYCDAEQGKFVACAGGHRPS